MSPKKFTLTLPDCISNAFAVDMQSGKVSVNFFGDINLQGNSIYDVKEIQGMFAKWKIDETGKITATDIQSDNLEVGSGVKFGSPENRIGITVYDEDTGEPYCMKVKGGQVAS